MISNKGKNHIYPHWRITLELWRIYYLSRILETTGKEQESNKLELTPESRRAFRKAMKIAYFKEFNKKGLITDEELEKLIALQNADKVVTKSA